MRRKKCTKSLTTDDMHSMNNCMNNNYMITLLHYINKQANLLGDINIMISCEDTNFILKHKPVFDTEKIKLIHLSNLINKVMNAGMKTRFNTIQIQGIVKLNEQTFNQSWNELSIKINECLVKLEALYDKEYCVIHIMRDPKTKIKHDHIFTRRCVLMWFVIAIILVCILVVYYKKYLTNIDLFH
jgi:hypothetical protein